MKNIRKKKTNQNNEPARLSEQNRKNQYSI